MRFLACVRAWPLNWPRFPYAERGSVDASLVCTECGVVGEMRVFIRPFVDTRFLRCSWSPHVRCDCCFAHFYLPAGANAGVTGF